MHVWSVPWTRNHKWTTALWHSRQSCYLSCIVTEHFDSPSPNQFMEQIDLSSIDCSERSRNENVLKSTLYICLWYIFDKIRFELVSSWFRLCNQFRILSRLSNYFVLDHRLISSVLEATFIPADKCDNSNKWRESIGKMTTKMRKQRNTEATIEPNNIHYIHKHSADAECVCFFSLI